MQTQQPRVAGLIGVDIGGTFTDVVAYTPPRAASSTSGQLNVYKVPSTPHAPVEGLLNGMRALCAEPGSVIIHGSTVATNALLERKGARATVTLLTDRRKRGPYGLLGGQAGTPGMNILERNDLLTELPGKVTFDVQAGDVLIISTPGGGGYLPREE
jgi:hypothetical protein